MRLHKRLLSIGVTIVSLLAINSGVVPVYASETEDVSKSITADFYELEGDAAYSIDNGTQASNNMNRFSVTGPIASTSEKDGVISYAVDVDLDEKLSISLTDASHIILGNPVDGWEIEDDSAKKIESTELDGKIESGAIVIQTSKDGEIWITDASYTDVFDGADGVLSSELAEKKEPLYETTAAQLNNGCYYRIILAYKQEKRLEDTHIGPITTKNYDHRRYMEVYEFYAYNQNSNLTETLDVSDAYKLGDMDYLVRCKDDEYSGSIAIDNEDPHSSWEIGKFYLSGYTNKTERNNDNSDPIFLKTVGDKITLWFNLEQDINQCNGTSAIKVVADSDGSDQGFNTPRMDFGKGMLIIKKTDEHNGKTIQYYRNYLEASATAGADTKVELLEEGDYEVALDYSLEYDKTKLFGQSVLPKTLHYRVYFKFSIRNGDSKLFVRDAKTDEFIDNANIAENGFYLDLAKQQYLTLTLKREVMTDSLDGLVADTKFNGAAKEGRMYTDEGIYTITATNKYTSAETVKKVYVGDSDVLKAYTQEGNTYTIAELNEMIAAGAYVDDDGVLVLPNAEVASNNVTSEETGEEKEEFVVKDNIEEDRETSESDEKENDVKIEEASKATTSNNNMVFVIGAIAVVIIAGLLFGVKKRAKKVSDNEQKGE